MSHTPGPWAVEYSQDRQEGNDQRPMPFVVDRKGGRIARLWVRGTAHAANASLIAAAPELLDTIRDILYASDGCRGHRDCNHSMAPWEKARALLVRFDDPKETA